MRAGPGGGNPRLKIEVPGQNVKPQEEFAVTLSLYDIPSIAALGFHISYDKTRLELLECEMAPEGFNLYINTEKRSLSAQRIISKTAHS